MKGPQKIAERLISQLYSDIMDGEFGFNDKFDIGAFQAELDEIIGEIHEIGQLYDKVEKETP